MSETSGVGRSNTNSRLADSLGERTEEGSVSRGVEESFSQLDLEGSSEISLEFTDPRKCVVITCVSWDRYL